MQNIGCAGKDIGEALAKNRALSYYNSVHCILCYRNIAFRK